MPVFALRSISQDSVQRTAIPEPLVRDLLVVGLITEPRLSARQRLEASLGRKTAAAVLRRTLLPD